MGLTLAEQIALHEGFKPYIYDDTTGQRLRSGDIIQGTPTFGYGFTSVEQEESLRMLLVRIAQTDTDLRAALPWFLNLSDNRQRVLLDMVYNLGLPRLRTFRKTLEAIQAGDWALAATEMLDSKWARQVGSRAHVLANMMQFDCSFESALSLEH